MKVIVKNIFRDKYTNKIYKIGEILDIDKNRAIELEKYTDKVKIEKNKEK